MSWLRPGEAGSDSGPAVFTRPLPTTVLLLASASTGRAGTLRRAGIEPMIRVSDVNEDAILAQFEDISSAEDAPAKVTALAAAKATAVISDLSGEEVVDFALSQGMPVPTRVLVVGCDSMLDVAGELVGKPHSPEVAYQRIKQLSGSKVCLFTGHAMSLLEVIPVSLDSGVTYELRQLGLESQAESTDIQFTELNDFEIISYIATQEPLFVAGAFTIDGLGGPFIRGVKGDPHSVVGISLPLLRSLTMKFGVEWPTLWNKVDV
ncbi:Maf-like protein [Gleimia coleocanis DSM 15436]|uniref:Nucleoside triphosphate pyrophosphatase n=1 Tax=Gleimia coleocanis DSM 15436 TaxID=525245 RepID=C0W0Q2_9ACTO|nr:Maf family protein [Gleimia coleocanis]EEH63626.1 Maf-like protein [Gleimia coleocanis DSM 15436]